MGRFLLDTDYNMQARSEIMNLLDPSEEQSKKLQAEATAQSQISKRLGKRYDLNQVFAPIAPGGADSRDPFIVMTMIDIVLYHLWSGEAAGKIPAVRKERYQDALDWLKDEGTGTGAGSGLPEKAAPQYASGFKLISRPPNNHKY